MLAEYFPVLVFIVISGALGVVLLATGGILGKLLGEQASDEEKAAEYFRRITESSVEHVHFTIPYVRRFYFLGKIHENRGEIEKAREYYRRFYEYWKDGDLDRDRVQEAAEKRGQAQPGLLLG